MATEVWPDTLEYDADARTLIATERLSADEYGASRIVASNVAPSFGVWAVAVWPSPYPLHPGPWETCPIADCEYWQHADGLEP